MSGRLQSHKTQASSNKTRSRNSQRHSAEKRVVDVSLTKLDFSSVRAGPSAAVSDSESNSTSSETHCFQLGPSPSKKARKTIPRNNNAKGKAQRAKAPTPVAKDSSESESNSSSETESEAFDPPTFKKSRQRLRSKFPIKEERPSRKSPRQAPHKDVNVESKKSKAPDAPRKTRSSDRGSSKSLSKVQEDKSTHNLRRKPKTRTVSDDDQESASQSKEPSTAERRRLSALSDHFPDIKISGFRRFTRSLARKFSHSSAPTLAPEEGGSGSPSPHKGSRKVSFLKAPQLADNNNSQNQSSTSSGNTGACASSACVSAGTTRNSVHPQGSDTNIMASPNSNVPADGNHNNQPSGVQNQTSADLAEQAEMGRLQALLEARGFSSHIFSALGPRMQGLLHRSGAGNPMGSKVQSLLTGIQTAGDESAQLQAVMEMCQILLMGNEDTLGPNFPIKQVVTALITLLQMEHNFDMMTHACRALTYIMEALPRSSAVVCEAVPALLEKLRRIECMDVAEQSLTALEMLSRRHSKAILNAGGVGTCLLYVDFFSINAQRCALNIASNCCYHMSGDDFNLISDSLDALTQRISTPDKKSVESVCLCFTRMVDNFQVDKTKLQAIAAFGLLSKLQHLLVMSPPVLNTNTFVSVIRMMHLICHGCSELAVQLLKQDVAETLRFLLLGTSGQASSDVELVARTPQELHEIVCLIGELMPRLPSDGIFSVDCLLVRTGGVVTPDVVWQWKDDNQTWRPYSAIDCRILETAYQAREDEVSINALGRTYTIDFQTMTQINEESGTSRSVQRKAPQGTSNQPRNLAAPPKELDARQELLKSEPQVVENFVKILFPVLYEVYSSSAGPSVRHECLNALRRMIFHSPAELLAVILKNQTISSHIANMLNSQDLKVVVCGVQLVHVLLEKLPEIFSVFFRREGVMHEIDKLAEAPIPSLASGAFAAGPRSTGARPLGLASSDTNLTTFSSFLLSSSGADPASASMPYYSFLSSLAGGGGLQAVNSAPAVFGAAPAGSGGGVASWATVHPPGSGSGSAHPLGGLSTGFWQPLAVREIKKEPPDAISDTTPKGEGAATGRPSKRAGGRLRGASGSSTEAAAGGGGATTGMTTRRRSEEQAHKISRDRVTPPVEVHVPQTRSRTARAKTVSGVEHETSTTPAGNNPFSGLLSSLPLPKWARSSQSERTGNTTASATAVSGSGAGSAKNAGAGPTFVERYVALPPHYVVAGLSGAQNNPNREKIRDWIFEQAKELKKRYFSEGTAAMMGSHPALNVLGKLSKLSECLMSKDAIDATLHDLCTFITESDVSSFEILHSGLVKSLLAFVTEPGPDLEQRLRQFCAVFLVISKQADGMTLQLESPIPLAMLIAKLNACLTQIEQFPVKVHDLPGGPAGCLRGINALKFFHTHQMKCALRRHPDCKELKQWKRGPVKIDPLALVSAIERYLLIKGFGRVKDQGESEDQTDEENSEDEMEDALTTTLSTQASGQHKLQLLLNDHVLPYNLTIYQAIRQFGMPTPPTGGPAAAALHDSDLEAELNALAYASIWVNTHTITYRLAPEAAGATASSATAASATAGQKDGDKQKDGTALSVAPKEKRFKGKASPKSGDAALLWTDGVIPEHQSPLHGFLTPHLPGVSVNDPSLECLALLRVLHALSRYWWTLYDKDTIVPSYKQALPPGDFVNSKLTAKANRQLQDPLIIMTGNLPIWLRQIAYACPFLFPFEARQLLLYVVAFDRDRALQRLLDACPDLLGLSDGQERITPRLERKKTTIQRDDLLKQAEAVIQDVGSSLAVLEVQYKDEVGTGLGPTLEFYALVSKELQKADLELWRGEKLMVHEDKNSTEYVLVGGQGLFPLPLPHQTKPSAYSRVAAKFKFLGKLMARALMDNRILDLPLNTALYKWLLGQERTLSLADVGDLDAQLQRSLQHVHSYAVEKVLREKNGTLGQVKVEDLDLDFTLPGTTQFELKKGGLDCPVTVENVQQYVDLAVHWLLNAGVSHQMEALREGFESVFSLSHLRMFYPEEMDQLFCGASTGSSWDVGTLLQCVRPDHGYTHDSAQIQWLAAILAAFNSTEQRRFLQFVTGCPKLPVGGFRNLTPPLTVVRKGVSSPAERPDDFLPSVMTCVNYLKLPEYSGVEVMRERLQLAIAEGQKSFHLS